MYDISFISKIKKNLECQYGILNSYSKKSIFRKYSNTKIINKDGFGSYKGVHKFLLRVNRDFCVKIIEIIYLKRKVC